MKTEREETWMQSEESCFGVKAWKTEAEHRAWARFPLRGKELGSAEDWQSVPCDQLSWPRSEHLLREADE